MPDLTAACKGADILIFVMPHQFVRQTCKTMQEHIKDSALAVSLIKVNCIMLMYFALISFSRTLNIKLLL